MLKKLIAFDFRFIVSKTMIVYYIITFSLAVTTRVLFLFDDVLIMNIIAKIVSGATISSFFSTLINNVIHCWLRFKINLFADESYLTHTLPVKRGDHYLSKVISGALSVLLTFAVILAAVFVAYYSPTNFNLLKTFMSPVLSALNSGAFSAITMIVIILFFEFINLILCGYIGILLGHRFQNGKNGFSFLFGAIVYVVSQWIVFFLVFLVAVCSGGDILQIFTQESVDDLSVFSSLIWAGNVAYFLLAILGTLVGKKLLEKGVNVD